MENWIFLFCIIKKIMVYSMFKLNMPHKFLAIHMFKADIQMGSAQAIRQSG